MNIYEMARDAILEERSKSQDREINRIKRSLSHMRNGSSAYQRELAPFFIPCPPAGSSKQEIAELVNQYLSEYERIYRRYGRKGSSSVNPPNIGTSVVMIV